MKKLFFIIVILAVFPLFPAFAEEVEKPQIQLSNLYHEGVDVTKYLVSEKLDGVRGYFDGEKLVSREGRVYNAPEWFLEGFPKECLEGELWIARGKFEEVSGVVRKEVPDEEEWKQVRLMLFDMPQSKEVFEKRYEDMKMLVENSGSKYLQVIEQAEITDHKSLMEQLEKIVKNGGEGLMLHRRDALYKAARNDDLLKLKTFEDAEATVISYIAGKGKYAGVMGALLVENDEKQRFKIGGGFSDEERKFPPKIGSRITYKFFGKTKNNKPRFASFIRVREEF